MSARPALPVVSCPGLTLDSLGNYLAALGLLSIAARIWSGARGAWHNETFCLVGGPADKTSLSDAVLAYARGPGFSRYERVWMPYQGKDTKAGSAGNVALWRSTCSEDECRLLDAHLIPTDRLVFNPVLGTGGNSGRRDFAAGWHEATSALSAGDTDVEPDLTRFLNGHSCMVHGYYNGSSWFSQRISPWAMAFACEGLPVLAGKVSRRLGANTRRLAAFPFTTEAAAPVRENEAGRILAEVWAPVWERPLAQSEVVALFARGRAELRNGRVPAKSAASFAAAIIQRGIDAGVAEIRRYVLTRTTSSQTFESTLAKTIRLRSAPARATASAVDRIVQIRDALPRDELRAKRWVFRGLRGPIDEALVELATKPEDIDAACELLDSTWRSLERVDLNSAYRASQPQFRLLPLGWLRELFRGSAPPPEAVIAMSLASLSPSESELGKVGQFLSYRLGVEPVRRRGGPIQFTKESPPRRVWSRVAIERDLSRVLRRRLLDAAPMEAPFRSNVVAPISAVMAFLNGDLDFEALGRWLSRMCLFDWGSGERMSTASVSYDGPADGLVALYGFFKPLFHVWPVVRRAAEASFFPGVPPRAAAVTRVAARLDAGDIAGALMEARARYRAGSRFPAPIVLPSADVDTTRLLAALLIPISSRRLIPLAERWLVSKRVKENPE